MDETFRLLQRYSAPTIFRNLPKRSLACMERGILQARYPLWFTVRLSLLKPDSTHWEASYPQVGYGQGSSVGLSPVKFNKYPVYQFWYLIWNARPDLEPMINGTRGAITPSMHQLFYENTTYVYYIYNYMYTRSLCKYKTKVHVYIKYYKFKILAHFKPEYLISSWWKGSLIIRIKYV
jgi:hypothetical protein